MKLVLLFLAVLAACILWPTDLSLAQCPEDPNDNGICDTLSAELYPTDERFTGPGHLVRVPIFITNDIPDMVVDSITAMVIPFCYTHTNPAAYCSLPAYWNRSPSSIPQEGYSILRDLDDITQNTFLDMSPYPSSEDFVLDISSEDQYFRFLWISASPGSQRWPGGNRRLAFTVTFRVKDTMTVCVDTCFWPITGPYEFVRSDAISYVPRDNIPYCFSISPPQVGDLNADGQIEIGDVVYLINYLFREGPAPLFPQVGDANCDGDITVDDVVYLINYLFKNGPPPEC